MTRHVFAAVSVFCLLGVLGCARRAQPTPPSSPPPVVQEAPPPPPAPAPEPTQPAPAAEAPLTEDALFARKSVADLNAEMPLADIFFDYDASGVRDDARAVLERNSEWLRRWPSTRVTAEGHADARGTNQYNLALSDRRARSAIDYLAALGIPAERLVAVGRGEESPSCQDETEICWQQNRRVRFVITSK